MEADISFAESVLTATVLHALSPSTAPATTVWMILGFNMPFSSLILDTHDSPNVGSHKRLTSFRHHLHQMESSFRHCGNRHRRTALRRQSRPPDPSTRTPRRCPHHQW